MLVQVLVSMRCPFQLKVSKIIHCNHASFFELYLLYNIIFLFIAFQQSDVTVAITFSSVPTTGGVLNVTCRATVPERFIYPPYNIIISYDSGSQMVVAEDNPDATQSAISTDGNIFSRVVTINPVKTSDGRRYHCIVPFDEPSNFIINNNEDLQVYSKYMP